MTGPGPTSPVVGVSGVLSSFPIGDWQFWAVTVLFVLAAAWLLRGVLPIPILSKRHRRSKRSHRATLTVGGKSLDKRRR